MDLRRVITAGSVALAAMALGACGGSTGAGSPGPVGDSYDAGRSFADLRSQVEMGPRPAGSGASRALAERLREQLPDGRFEPVPGGLRNVVGELPGDGAPIVLGAHYDTKDIPGFVGANDGAGGVALVLEAARALAADRRSCQRELRLVMFDGEESPAGSTDFMADGLRGSRAYAEVHAGDLNAMVLVDFVADRDLAIPREASSDPALWARLRAAAAAVGAERAFPDRTARRIVDDHTPFLERAVPAIDVIDFDYPYFHTSADTLDKVSEHSLDLVGETVVELLRRMRADTCTGG